ncbi:GNAT family N-acetyltransferase [Kineococcus sp. NPDC059986]|uniref:GNAT family N-acetyltransferase n=1 Tax=Kineococcus sp. NPDC059986 TaxID=3155538 RepID=UPI00344C8F6D
MTDSETRASRVDVDGVVIDLPNASEAGAIGRMQLLSWHQTYPNAERGIDAQWIDEQMMPRTSPAADEFRRGRMTAQRLNPEGTLYRVARNGSDIVAFVHASRPDSTPSIPTSAARRRDDDAGQEAATLDALYVLCEHQGSGLADHLMTVVLDWLGDQAMRLEVASYNARAIRFYQRHGFRLTGHTAVFRDRIPIVSMLRAEGHRTFGGGSRGWKSASCRRVT